MDAQQLDQDEVEIRGLRFDVKQLDQGFTIPIKVFRSALYNDNKGSALAITILPVSATEPN
eukprot:1362801-Amorphochlora_amoeboformis.AAC.2